MENRNGLIAAAMVTHADGYAERDAALLMLQKKQQGSARRITIGADKAYDTKDFVRTVREWNVTPYITGTTRIAPSTWTAEPRGIAVMPSA